MSDVHDERPSKHTQKITHTHLISGQDLEGGDDLVCCVRVGRFPGHEVNEGLEGDGAAAIGVNDAHDASKLGVALATKSPQVNPGETHFVLRHTDADRTRRKCVNHQDLHDTDLMVLMVYFTHAYTNTT